MRISDADRTRAVDELRRHCEAGRIDLDAYAERIAAAMEAETLADLDHALRDLPRVRIADPATSPPLMAPGGGRERRGDGPGGGGWRARLVVVLTVLVVALGACFLVLAHWVWAVVLVVGWLAGAVGGRVRPGRR